MISLRSGRHCLYLAMDDKKSLATVQSQHYGTVPALRYSPNTTVQSQHYGTVPTLRYSPNTTVQSQHYGTVPALLYSPSTQ